MSVLGMHGCHLACWNLCSACSDLPVLPCLVHQYWRAATLQPAQPRPPCALPTAVAIRQAAGQLSPADSQPLQLAVRGPSRFFSLEAATAGGSATVEVIQEGSLRLRTGGGGISVPKVRLAPSCQRSPVQRGQRAGRGPHLWLPTCLRGYAHPLGRPICSKAAHLLAGRVAGRSKPLTRTWTLAAARSQGR